MDKIEKVYFTSGVDANVFNKKVFGICRILQNKINEIVDKQAEIVDFINAVQIIESRTNLFKGE